jgi:molybdopterin-dependent oxidoreductase alpha subunit
MDNDQKPSLNKSYAGGIPALTSTLKHLLHEKAMRPGISALLKMNQPDGFDCPGCAWPDPENPSVTEFCENGAKAIAAETTTKRITADFFRKHPVSELLKKDGYWLEQQGRLCEPMLFDRQSDHYQPISWEKAFELIGHTMKQLSHPDEAVLYTSGRTSNEAAFLYQLFGRELGTNNFPDCSNMCHESSGVAMTESVGIGKGTVSLEDFQKATAIFIIGQNPGTNHPRMLSSLEEARKNGCQIVTFNPLKEKGLQRFIHPQNIVRTLTNNASSISSSYYQPLIGGDFALIKGIIKGVLEAEHENPGQLDWDFIKDHTLGFKQMHDDILSTSWDVIVEESGLTKADILKASHVYLQSEATIACWAMGVTQHKHAVLTIQYIANLMFLKGNIGRPGAGLCPVRGHSNVQGDRTMGITENPSKQFLQSLGQAFQFTPPLKHGYHAVDAIKAMDQGKVKVFVGMGGNFAAATPDSTFTEQALRKCDLTVQVSTKLNRSHLVTGKQGLILPCLGRTERDEQKGHAQRVTVEDSMSMIHASEGHNIPASNDLLSEPAIVALMAIASLPKTKTDWAALAGNYELIRSKIEEVFPDFKHFNEKIKNRGGFYLGNSARDRKWQTKTGKANFITGPLPTLGLGAGQLRLMTIRSHDQYNTTIYGLDDRYRGVKGERHVIFLNAVDIKTLHLKENDVVDIISNSDGIDRVAKNFRIIEHDIPPGCAASYFPETNVLVPIDSVADKSFTPTSKFVVVQLKKNTL